MAEAAWHTDEQVAARGICGIFHGMQACGCAPEACLSRAFSTFADAAVAALRVNNRLIGAPEPGRGTIAPPRRAVGWGAS